MNTDYGISREMVWQGMVLAERLRRVDEEDPRSTLTKRMNQLRARMYRRIGMPWRT